MRKKTDKPRKIKYVIWLHNRVDNRDDEWKVVWANSSEEARQSLEYDHHRFSEGRTYTAADFYRIHGFRAK